MYCSLYQEVIKMKLGSIIHSYRKEHKLSMDALAERSGLSKAYIAILENEKNPISGKPAKPSLETIQKLAKSMKLTTDDLISMMDADALVSFERQEDEETGSVKRPVTKTLMNINIYKDTSGSSDLFMDDQIIETISLPACMLPDRDAEYFGRFAMDDSMSGAGINDGDLVIFQKTDAIESGEIGCFRVDENTVTCKIFSRIGEMIYLFQANNQYQPIPIEPKKQRFQVLGTKALLIKK